MTATHHPPVGLVPPPPPAPTPEDGVRWLRQPMAQPQPATQPAPQAAVPQPIAQDAQPPAQPAPPAVAAKKRSNRVYAAIVGVPLAMGAMFVWQANRHSAPEGPSEMDVLRANITALATDVSTLAAGTTQTPAPETNPLTAMPCGLTNDAKRFIGVDANGAPFLAPSVTVSRQVYELIRGGARYEDLVVRTGVSITQLEVDQRGGGVVLFNCGAPPATAPAPQPAAATIPAAPAATPGA